MISGPRNFRAVYRQAIGFAYRRYHRGATACVLVSGAWPTFCERHQVSSAGSVRRDNGNYRSSQWICEFCDLEEALTSKVVLGTAGGTSLCGVEILTTNPRALLK